MPETSGTATSANGRPRRLTRPRAMRGCCAASSATVSSLILPAVAAESASVRSDIGSGPKTWKTTTRAFDSNDAVSAKLSIASGSLKSPRASAREYEYAVASESRWSSSRRSSTRRRSREGTTIRYAPPSEPPTIRSSATARVVRIPPGRLIVPEPIAGAAHGEDQLGLAGVALDLLAQVAHVDVDRPRLAVVGAAADALEQLPAAEDDAGIAREERQELELDEGELDRRVAHLDGAAR